MAPASRTRRAVATKSLAVLYDEALNAKISEKGKRLELFAVALVREIVGLKVLRTNAVLAAEELDVLVQNDLAGGFWHYIGSPVIIECKNWSVSVGAREISILAEKLRSLAPDAKTAILIAPNGVTGDRNADAWLKIRELRQLGRYILVLDNELLQRIIHGEQPTSIIEIAFQKLWLL